MGEVIPFERLARPGWRWLDNGSRAAPDPLMAIRAAARTGRLDDVVEASRPLLRAFNRSGFAVMRSGLPSEPEVLVDALATLASAIALLDSSGSRRPTSIGVYLGRPALAWFEDGYGGATGLGVPSGTTPTALAAFVTARFPSVAAGG